MMRAIGIGILAAALLGGLTIATPAAAQLNSDECKCQTATGKAQGKFAAAKAKCLAKCQAAVRAGSAPASDCQPPYGGATAECVNKAETKAIATETKCKDCPECYSGGNCLADATARTASTESQIDGLAPTIFCDDTGSPDGLNDDEAKCQQAEATNMGKFAAAKAKCYSKCRAAVCKGKIPAGSCTPGSVSDPSGKTQACISKAETKCVESINKVCADKPECSSAYDGAFLCAAVEAAVDSRDASTYCGSPSGAFLD